MGSVIMPPPYSLPLVPTVSAVASTRPAAGCSALLGGAACAGGCVSPSAALMVPAAASASGLGLSEGSNGSAVCAAPFSATGCESLAPQPENSNRPTQLNENIHRMRGCSFRQQGAFQSIHGSAR